MNINAAKSLEKRRKQFASKQERPHHLGQVIVWVIHLYLHIYCANAIENESRKKGLSERERDYLCTFLYMFCAPCFSSLHISLKKKLRNDVRTFPNYRVAALIIIHDFIQCLSLKRIYHLANHSMFTLEISAMVLKFSRATGFFRISRFCWLLVYASLHHTCS